MISYPPNLDFCNTLHGFVRFLTIQHHRFQDAFQVPFELQKSPKMAPKYPQEPPKSLPRRPKSLPRCSQDSPRGSQDAPRASQEPPKTPQDAPRGSQELPRGSQEASRGSQEAPRGSHRLPKRPPKASGEISKHPFIAFPASHSLQTSRALKSLSLSKHLYWFTSPSVLAS